MMIVSLLGNHIGSIQAINTNEDIIKKVLMLTVGIMMITLLFTVLK